MQLLLSFPDYEQGHVKELTLNSESSRHLNFLVSKDLWSGTTW